MHVAVFSVAVTPNCVFLKHIQHLWCYFVSDISKCSILKNVILHNSSVCFIYLFQRYSYALGNLWCGAWKFERISADPNERSGNNSESLFFLRC